MIDSRLDYYCQCPKHFRVSRYREHADASFCMKCGKITEADVKLRRAMGIREKDEGIFTWGKYVDR